MNSIDTKAGVLIISHRTPEHKRLPELVRAFYAYWHQMDANHCLQVTFEEKPIYFNDEAEEAYAGDD